MGNDILSMFQAISPTNKYSLPVLFEKIQDFKKQLPSKFLTLKDIKEFKEEGRR